MPVNILLKFFACGSVFVQFCSNIFLNSCMFQINMPTLARKQQYKKEYSREFSGIKQGKDEYHAHCIPCSNEINLTSMGKTAIRVHQETPKHKENAKAPTQQGFLCFDCFCYLIFSELYQNFCQAEVRRLPSMTRLPLLREPGHSTWQLTTNPSRKTNMIEIKLF